MTQSRFAATDVKANGDLRLPKRVRQVLHLGGKGGRVGFRIQGTRVMLTPTTMVPKSSLSQQEMAFLADVSKRGLGKRTFRTKDAALQYLWGL